MSSGTLVEDAPEPEADVEPVPAAPLACSKPAPKRSQLAFWKIDAPKGLDRDGLKERLDLNSPELVDELYDVVTRLHAGEVGRQTRLDAKATSLLSGSGLAVTLTFAFGAALATAIGDKKVLEGWLIWPYLAAVACGLSAGVFAVWALLARKEYRSLSEEIVFHAGALEGADAKSDDEKGRLKGVRDYRRYLIVALWPIYRQHYQIQEMRGRLIKLGQLFFVGFIASLFLVCLGIVISVIL